MMSIMAESSLKKFIRTVTYGEDALFGFRFYLYCYNRKRIYIINCCFSWLFTSIILRYRFQSIECDKKLSSQCRHILLKRYQSRSNSCEPYRYLILWNFLCFVVLVTLPSRNFVDYRKRKKESNNLRDFFPGFRNVIGNVLIGAFCFDLHQLLLNNINPITMILAAQNIASNHWQCASASLHRRASQYR